MDDLKSIIGKVATGATLSREEAASAFDSLMSGEATPSQMGGLLMALRVRGETVEEITGAVSAMRSKMLRVDSAARGGRHRRHRRRRLRLGQCLDLRVVHRCRHGRPRCQAWQPRAVVALGRRRRAGLARRENRSEARAGRPLRQGGRDRLHVRAVPSSRDEECRSDPRRARDANDLQPARARSPIRPASSARWSACSRDNGCSRWRRS